MRDLRDIAVYSLWGLRGVSQHLGSVVGCASLVRGIFMSVFYWEQGFRGLGFRGLGV